MFFEPMCPRNFQRIDTTPFFEDGTEGAISDGTKMILPRLPGPLIVRGTT